MGFNLGEYAVNLLLCILECGRRAEDFDFTESVEDEKSGGVPFFPDTTAGKEKENNHERVMFFSQ
jgi:hypothetical protein